MRSSTAMKVGLPIAVIALMAAVILTKERDRQQHPSAPPQPPPSTILAHTILPMSTPEYPPDQNGLRYGHSTLALGFEGQVYATYEYGTRGGDPSYAGVVVAHASGNPQEAPRITPVASAVAGEPTIVTMAAESGLEIWWAAAEGGVRVIVDRAPTPDQLVPGLLFGRNTSVMGQSHPMLVASRNGVVLVYVSSTYEGDAAFVSASLLSFNERLDHRPLDVAKVDPDWRTFQPPHAVLSPDGNSVLVTLKAEFDGRSIDASDPNAPVGKAGLPMATPESGAVESELLVYRVTLDGSEVPPPAVLALRAEWTYHERPLLASTSDAVYAVVGTWRPKDVPDPLIVRSVGAASRELRTYTLEVLKSTDGGLTWTPTAEAFAPMQEIATAAPQLAAIDNTVVLAYAVEGRHLELAEIGVMHAVMSHDAGATWSPPQRIVDRLSDRVTDVPMDIAVTTESAYLLFRRTETKPPIGDSIQVPPPDISLAVAVWDIAAK